MICLVLVKDQIRDLDTAESQEEPSHLHIYVLVLNTTSRPKELKSILVRSSVFKALNNPLTQPKTYAWFENGQEKQDIMKDLIFKILRQKYDFNR